ncbi:MAG: hypothetical protein JWM52_426 [Candidatus Saccharibacteria bacterium]|nr:hypothetical protein [Candidatus Saccharibacteria bacterium]
MAFKLTRKKIIIGVIVAIIVLGGAAFAVVTFVLPAKNTTPTGADTTFAKGVPSKANRETLSTSQNKVTKLLAAGDEKSVTAAKAILDAQITEAEKTSDEAFSFEAQIAKAQLLIDTDQPQEAIDTILLPLEKKYGNDDTYKDTVFGNLSNAYYTLGDSDKGSEYYKKLPVKEFN